MQTKKPHTSADHPDRINLTAFVRGFTKSPHCGFRWLPLWTSNWMDYSKKQHSDTSSCNRVSFPILIGQLTYIVLSIVQCRTPVGKQKPYSLDFRTFHTQKKANDDLHLGPSLPCCRDGLLRGGTFRWGLKLMTCGEWFRRCATSSNRLTRIHLEERQPKSFHKRESRGNLLQRFVSLTRVETLNTTSWSPTNLPTIQEDALLRRIRSN